MKSIKHKKLLEVVYYFEEQKNLAKELEISPQVLSSWLRGIAKMPIKYALKIDYLTQGYFPFVTLLDDKTRIYLGNLALADSIKNRRSKNG